MYNRVETNHILALIRCIGMVPNSRVMQLRCLGLSLADKIGWYTFLKMSALLYITFYLVSANDSTLQHEKITNIYYNLQKLLGNNANHIQGGPLFSYTQELSMSKKSNTDNVLKSSSCLRVAYIWNNDNEIRLESEINNILILCIAKRLRA